MKFEICRLLSRNIIGFSERNIILVCAEEVKFGEALRRYTYILRGVDEKTYIAHPDKYKEMDLFLAGTDYRDGKPHHVVVEIKNPTTIKRLMLSGRRTNLAHRSGKSIYCCLFLKNKNRTIGTVIPDIKDGRYGRLRCI
jgi:hypothetical protein